MKEQVSKIWFFIKKYKYIITSVFFIVWIFFIAQTGIMFKSKLNEEINFLEKRKAYYVEEIEKNEKYYQDLLTNPATKERLAREEYFMSKDNEDVFIIVDKTDK
ncbi:MAG: septum formation initiator family protein [Bacteroidales bacterium]|nr:septum formation initiator family protein [Bacteroidales bacterium]